MADDTPKGRQAPVEKPVEKVVQRPNIIQRAQVNPGDLADAAINAAEARQAQEAEASRSHFAASLPKNTLDEMEAGRAALARHAPAKA